MNILCLHPVLSMRAVKEMAAVKASGHRVILVYEGVGSSASIDKGDFWDKIIKIPPVKSKFGFKIRRLLPKLYKTFLKKTIKEECIDLIHVFSMPDTLAVASIKYVPIPVVYDIRDLTTGMNKTPLFETKIPVFDRLQQNLHRILEKKFEEYAVKNSDMVVCVTETMANKVKELYKIPSKKIIFLESYPIKESIPKTTSEKLSKDGEIHLVYAGNIFPGLENSGSLIQQLAENEMNIHLYPTGSAAKNSKIKNKFKNNQFIHFHEPLKAKDLLSVLPQYDYGLVLYSPDKDQLNRSLTISNKLLEYLACGIPVASTDMEASKRFLNKHNAGLVFDNGFDLAEKARKLKNTFSIREDDFYMEGHIHKLLKLYDVVINSAE